MSALRRPSPTRNGNACESHGSPDQVGGSGNPCKPCSDHQATSRSGLPANCLPIRTPACLSHLYSLRRRVLRRFPDKSLSGRRATKKEKSHCHHQRREYLCPDRSRRCGWISSHYGHRPRKQPGTSHLETGRGRCTQSQVSGRVPCPRDRTMPVAKGCRRLIQIPPLLCRKRRTPPVQKCRLPVEAHAAQLVLMDRWFGIFSHRTVAGGGWGPVHRRVVLRQT